MQPVARSTATSSTGLARPEVDVNWSEYLKQITAQYDPNVVVFTVGSNDDQPLTGGPPTGDLGNPEWDAEYRRRVGGIMDQVVGEGRTLVWVGNPPIRNMERAEGEYKVINEIFRSEAAKRPGRVFYVDIYSMFLDGSGNYADYLDTGAGAREGAGRRRHPLHPRRRQPGRGRDLQGARGQLRPHVVARPRHHDHDRRERPSGGPGGKSGTTTRTTRPPPATVGPGGPAVP